MTTDEARGIVLKALADAAPHIDVTTVAAGDDFRDDLELDSLDFLSFIEALAGLSGAELPESDYASLRSVESSTQYLATAVPAG